MFYELYNLNTDILIVLTFFLSSLLNLQDEIKYLLVIYIYIILLVLLLLLLLVLNYFIV